MGQKSSKPDIKLVKEELLQLTLSFCNEYLDEEYTDLCSRLIDKMSRKRQVPYLSGRLTIWAGAVIHALGTINFLFDRSTQPYVAAPQIAEHFEASLGTISQKGKVIRDMFKMGYWDSEFATKRMQESSPLANLMLINGFFMRTR